MAEPVGSAQRFYGKYSGRVVHNVETAAAVDTLHRIAVSVPTVFPDGRSVWARPCVPYAGPGVGLYAKPPEGTAVWVEFEGGNLNSPIWSGCCWEELQLTTPLREEILDPAAVKLIQTKSTLLELDDTEGEGGVTLKVSKPAVAAEVTLKFSSLGAKITTGVCTLSMDPEKGITLSVGEVTLSLSPEGIRMRGPKITAEASGEISISGDGKVTVSAGIDAELKAKGAAKVTADAAAQVTAGADVSISAKGAVKVSAKGLAEVSSEADTTISAKGLTQIKADGAMKITAGLDVGIGADVAIQLKAPAQAILGIMEVTGDLLLEGQQVMAI